MDGETEATVAFKERWREGGREREKDGWMERMALKGLRWTNSDLVTDS